MWTRQELKERGKLAFRANYWPNVLAALLLSLLTAGGSVAGRTEIQNTDYDVQFNQMPDENKIGLVLIVIGALIMVMIVSVLLDIFLFNPLQIGCYAFFKQNIQDGNADLSLIKEGFSDYGHKFFTMFLSGLFIALWSLLLVIPGIIKMYSYRMVPFIVRDDPELAPMEVIEKSKQMMNGQKWDTFVLDLSFIGWALLSGLTLGLVGLFWYKPYYYNTNAALYLKLSQQ